MSTVYIKASSPWSTIKAWQAFLDQQGLDAGKPDGIWGNHTLEATKEFQHICKQSPNGIVGKDTYDAAQQRGFSIPPIPVPEGNSNTVIDISHHQGKVDLSKAKAAGIHGVIHKATQASDPYHNDPTYDHHRQQAKQAGLLWGAYHFGVNEKGSRQADHFLDVAQPDGQTVLVLDYERQYTHGQKDPFRSMNFHQAIDFINRIKEKTGKYPIIYGGIGLRHDFSEAPQEQKDVAMQCPLWISTYRPRPRMPRGWEPYTLWQYSGDAFVDGVGYCDRSFFAGNDAELQQFWQGQAV